jgi:hypothetical protein
VVLLHVVSSLRARHERHIMKVEHLFKKDEPVLLVLHGHFTYVTLLDIRDVARKWCVSVTCLPHIPHVACNPSMCHSRNTNISLGFLVGNVRCNSTTTSVGTAVFQKADVYSANRSIFPCYEFIAFECILIACRSC